MMMRKFGRLAMLTGSERRRYGMLCKPEVQSTVVWSVVRGANDGIQRSLRYQDNRQMTQSLFRQTTKFNTTPRCCVPFSEDLAGFPMRSGQDTHPNRTKLCNHVASNGNRFESFCKRPALHSTSRSEKREPSVACCRRGVSREAFELDLSPEVDRGGLLKLRISREENSERAELIAPYLYCISERAIDSEFPTPTPTIAIPAPAPVTPTRRPGLAHSDRCIVIVCHDSPSPTFVPNRIDLE